MNTQHRNRKRFGALPIRTVPETASALLRGLRVRAGLQRGRQQMAVPFWRAFNSPFGAPQNSSGWRQRMEKEGQNMKLETSM